MKQADIATLVLIVFISLTFSFLIGNALFGGEENRSTQVEVVEPITADFPAPDPEVFNAQSVNPTQTVNIGGSNSENPFSSEN